MTHGNHLNNSNKTVDEDLEKENFKAAGEIQAKIWSESVIDDHPVVARYVDIPDTPRDAVECDKSEEWKKCTCCTIPIHVTNRKMLKREVL